ncbi:hypothetical protein K458DRAFT_369091 [Lentithecium fluviatile CBS 122367]|uniref:Uncharacterized protein n=1 Tax=Lentithecium fluviatile CBS 122367 TaxID=1168545 RepID=A0A6G1IXJ7_9PLEO|nr:hypothetical protein K458DRAFT_369091 [Lentithecium fluviatile CBS 122367]
MRGTFASLLVFAVTVSAIGDAIVINESSDTIYLWSVGDTTGEQVTIQPGGLWSEEFRRGSINPGVAIKITKEEGGLNAGAPTQILGYTLDGARVWYSLDAVNGEPFAGQALEVMSNGGGSIVWPEGKDIGDVTRDTSSEEDVVFTIS